MIIDQTKAVELLAEAVEKNGADYVDPWAAEGAGCWYVRDGAPSCFIGTAYALAGATVEQLRALDDSGKIEDAPEDALPVETTPEAVDVFAVAQAAQDSGYSWGEALAAARLAAEGAAA